MSKPKRTLLCAAGAALAVWGALGEYAIYPWPLEPRAIPGWARVHAKPVDKAVFKGRYDFVAFHGDVSTSTWPRIERMTKELDVGRILHPSIHSLFAPGREQDFTNLVQQVKDRDLVLFGPWWQVPAWGRQIHPSAEQYRYLERELGDRWFGMEDGEQDIRYLQSFCAGKWPQGGKDRFACYVDFNRHFDRLGGWMGDRLTLFTATTLVPHLLREGTYTCLGMESSQAHPNTQVTHAFIRGAGKQYGVPWYGDISVYGGWGWKNNRRARTEPLDPVAGREDMGTSYSLMKRLTYELWLYNCIFGQMETIQFDADGKLFGTGQFIRDLRAVQDRYGEPGVLYTPVAVMTDVFAGWNVPRVMRSEYCETWDFTVWGAVPYAAGDYLTLGVFDVLYPGYEAGHYFGDERGYIVGTPYGDIADAVLSDAPAWLLRRYPLLVLAGQITPTEELRDTLRSYLTGGGHLVLTEGNRSVLPSGAPGRVTVIPGAPWGVEANPDYKPKTYDSRRPRWGNDGNRMAPVRLTLTAAARQALEQAFAEVSLFRASKPGEANALSVIACRRGPGQWTVGVLNNGWSEQPLELSYCGGRIRRIEEIPTWKMDPKTVGYLPCKLTERQAEIDLGADTKRTIAGGSARIFRVETDDRDVRELARETPPPEPKNRTLSLYGSKSLREQLLARPTFFRHFDGIKIDARYLLEKSDFAAKEEARWLSVRKVSVMVDFTDLLDRFAGLRLTREDPVENARTDAMMGEITRKMNIYGVKDAVMALHHVDHNTMSPYMTDAVRTAYEKDAAAFVQKIRAAGSEVHLRMARYHVAADFGALDRWAKAIGARGAFSLASALALTKTPLDAGQTPLDETEVRRQAARRTDVLWLLALPGFRPENDKEMSLTEPLASNSAWARPYLNAARRKGVRLIFDAFYPDTDAEYRDARLVEALKKDE